MDLYVQTLQLDLLWLVPGLTRTNTHRDMKIRTHAYTLIHTRTKKHINV